MRVSRIDGDADFIGTIYKDVMIDSLLRKAVRTNMPIDPAIIVSLDYYFDPPENEGVVTDFPYEPNLNTLLMSARAAELLQPALEGVGPLLRVEPPTDMGYRMLFCTKEIDCLDWEKTEIIPDITYVTNPVGRYVFRPEALAGATIFRVKGLVPDLYATDAFFDLIRGHRLSGLKVRPVWCSEHGPLVTFTDPMLGVFDKYPPGYGSTVREKRQVMRDFIAGKR